MTIEEMKECKRVLGYSNEMLAEKSGVPLGTVQKVLGGTTKSPRKKTIDALSEVLAEGMRKREQGAFVHWKGTQEALYLREEAPLYGGKPAGYAAGIIEKRPDGMSAELIDGRMIFRGPDTRTHQKITGELYFAVAGYIRSNGIDCEVYLPPYGVYLFADNRTYLIPDLTVLCDRSISKEDGCHGAPDWVVEIVSSSSAGRDYAVKLFRYRAAGVKYYWIIDPDRREIMAYRFTEESEDVVIRSFDEEAVCPLFPDLKIRLGDTV